MNAATTCTHRCDTLHPGEDIPHHIYSVLCDACYSTEPTTMFSLRSPGPTAPVLSAVLFTFTVMVKAYLRRLASRSQSGLPGNIPLRDVVVPTYASLPPPTCGNNEGIRQYYSHCRCGDQKSHFWDVPRSHNCRSHFLLLCPKNLYSDTHTL